MHSDESGFMGKVVYDVENDKLIEVKYSQADVESLNDNGGTVYGFGHLIDAFRLMVKHNKYPETYRYIWF